MADLLPQLNGFSNLSTGAKELNAKGLVGGPTNTSAPGWLKFAQTGMSIFDAMSNRQNQAAASKDEAGDYLNRGMDVGKDFFKGMAQGGGFKGGLKNAKGGLGALAGDAMAGIGRNIAANKYGEELTESQKQTQSMIRSGLASIPGFGWAIAAASGAVDLIGSATGTNLSNLDKDAAKRAGVKGAGFNNAMNYIPGNSMIWGGMNALMGGQRTEGYNMSDLAEEMASGYSGTMDDLRAASKLGNKRMFTLKQERTANAFINDAKQKDDILRSLNETNTMRKQSNYAQDLAHQNINRYAGENYLGYRIGKSGMKLMSVEQARAIIALRKSDESIEKFQNGGTIGIDTNILPEGALHARKNHLSDVNPDLEDATKKGIPVMTAEEGGEIQQVAEIENAEIIFRLEVTKKLEELMKDGSDEAAIEAGKLIATELIENTQDNVGMITEEVQNGE